MVLMTAEGLSTTVIMATLGSQPDLEQVGIAISKVVLKGSRKARPARRGYRRCRLTKSKKSWP
ncbi:MAG: hypothetical protein IPN42_17725 [Methylococcaceae bacterium]|nr:hypothetical protein [Methylococcaceae bacterium]